jgi:hypothetical protein
MPRADERLRHVFLPPAEAVDFRQTNKGGRRKGPRYPQRDPDSHGKALAASLQEVIGSQTEIRRLREERDLSFITGINLTFDLELNPDLLLDSLEDRRAGIELLAFRPMVSGRGTATVFVPEGKLAVFERKLADYLAPEKTTKRGARRGESLINSIRQIRRSALEDLWTDPVRPFPGTVEPVWWEVWIRDRAGADRFRLEASRVEIEVGLQTLRFPDRSIVLARATVEQMTLSVDLLDSVAELKEARSFAMEIRSPSPREERSLVDALRDRMTSPPDECPLVCVLDTGVDVGHPLLERALPREHALSYDAAQWGVEDRHGHGTQMAGFALFGEQLDRLLLEAETLPLQHQIESVKIMPQERSNPPELYGEITQAAVARAEIRAPARPRVFSLSITDQKSPLGDPTSWSAAIDQICSGVEEGAPSRLVCVSSGNASVGSSYVYPDSNHTDSVQDPAQAWNAVTVGACTERTLIAEPDCHDWAVVAQTGDMSPCNTTSLAWLSHWPNKPDLVLEGGNMAWDPTAEVPDPLDSLSLLTTSRRNFGTRLLCWSGDTSAANASAARMGALVYSEYPDVWPETVRALLIHSARWTPAMEDSFKGLSERRRMSGLLRCYGYGVPSLDRALHSLRHSLTLVSQETLQPFRLEEAGAKSNEMHFHHLPWPREALESLGETTVRMRVTLSYFIEPKPGQRSGPGGKSQRYRYASYGLRFAVKTALEDERTFRRRINAAESLEDEGSEAESDTAEWRLGICRNRGSVHSDVWTGTALDLAQKHQIAVYPVIGWWRDGRETSRCNRRIRYALVVSLESEEAEVSIRGVITPVNFYSEVIALTQQIEIQ